MVFLYTVSKTSSCSQRYTVLPDEEVVQSFLYLQELQSEHLYSIFHVIFWCVFKKCKFISTRTCVFISLSVIYKLFFTEFIIFSSIISFSFFNIDIHSSINTFFDFRSIIIACICNNCRFQCNRKKGPSTIPARNNWRAFLFAILTKILISVHVLETGQLPFPQIFIRF